jgi:phosphomevalonate kinase
VPIEPESQTALLEESLRVEGVLLAGVPGAGGYDAICCVIADDGEDEDSTFNRLLGVWEKQKVRVCPLLAREETSGILMEDVEAFLA